LFVIVIEAVRFISFEITLSLRTRTFPKLCIRHKVLLNIHRMSNVLKMFKVRMLSNANANFVTSLIFVFLCLTENADSFWLSCLNKHSCRL